MGLVLAKEKRKNPRLADIGVLLTGPSCIWRSGYAGKDEFQRLYVLSKILLQHQDLDLSHL
jgi:hypothetical protein